MEFTNMRNDIYDDDIDDIDDSDDDSDYDSDNESSDDDDDNYEDFITGVEPDHSDAPDPPDANADETQHNENDNDNGNEDNDETDNDGDIDAPEHAEEDSEIVPTPLRKLVDHTGNLLPTIVSGTQQQAHATGESLATVLQDMPITKKEQKHRKDLLTQLLRQHEEENKKKLRNKLKNKKRKIRSKSRLGTSNDIPDDTDEPIVVETVYDDGDEDT
jgi:hypothetical protein